MPTRIWNRFDVWEWQEDTLVPWTARIIDSSNVTGLKTWLWITLWPKVNKLLLTNWAMRGFWLDDDTDNNNTLNFAYWEDWEIYRFDSLDNTPIYTHTNWNIIEWFFEINNRYYFQTNGDLYLGQATTNAFTSINEDYVSLPSFASEFAPVMKHNNLTYYGTWNTINIFESISDPWSTMTSKSLFTWSTIGITSRWWQIYVFTTNKDVALWDWWNTINWVNKLSIRPRCVYDMWWTIFMNWTEWSLLLWDWWNFQEFTSIKKSNRLNDNSWFKTKYDFWNVTLWTRGQTITWKWEKVYISSNWDTPWIYEYGAILPWLSKWFHKIITKNHNWDDIDEVFCMNYGYRSKKLYFAYRSWTTYWIDYIDTDSLESAGLGYFITEVFSANTTYIKKPKEIRLTVENVIGNNYVKIYERVNNWDWELLRTITNETETIFKKEIKNYTKENIEVQFKVELYRESWEAPIVRELYYDYEVITK